MGWLRNLSRVHWPVAWTERQAVSELTNPACRNSTRRTCAAARVDETSYRMLLCARCRSQVLICWRCDRGQIYCIGTCAQEARRDRQKEARQRYQATRRGRAMYADRNRHYRARRQRVTDRGLSMAHQVGLSPGLVVETAPSSGMSSEHRRCHHCGHPASAYLACPPFADVTVAREEPQEPSIWPRPLRRCDNSPSPPLTRYALE